MQDTTQKNEVKNMLRNVNNTVLNGDQVTYDRNVFGRNKRATSRVYFLFRTVLNSLN